MGVTREREVFKTNRGVNPSIFAVKQLFCSRAQATCWDCCNVKTLTKEVSSRPVRETEGWESHFGNSQGKPTQTDVAQELMKRI